jgi:hypothetical protein
MRKTILSASIIAIAAATPAYAWRAITLRANTDPDEILTVTFTAPGIKAVKFTLDMPGVPGWFRVFGPLPETGPCLRTLTVAVWNDYLGYATKAAATPMNVCTESQIYVTGAWPGMGGQAGGSELTVTHGF